MTSRSPPKLRPRSPSSPRPQQSKPSSPPSTSPLSKPISPCLIILRGIPGAGKTTLVSKIQNRLEHILGPGQTASCSNDHYFDEKPGGYEFSFSEMPDAIQHCKNQLSTALKTRKKVIFLDNTNLQSGWFYDFVEMVSTQGKGQEQGEGQGQAYKGYKILLVNIEIDNEEDGIRCGERNIHIPDAEDVAVKRFNFDYLPKEGTIGNGKFYQNQITLSGPLEGENAGVEEVLNWLKDECGVDVDKIKSKVVQQIGDEKEEKVEGNGKKKKKSFGFFKRRAAAAGGVLPSDPDDDSKVKRNSPKRTKK